MEELPIPLSRVELYLAKAAGMDVTPPEPKSRLELFLAKIAGMDVETPLPLSLKEQWLSCVYYGTTSDHPMLEGAYYIDNQKVDVRYLAVASGVPGATLPAKPQNRKEQYWAMIAIHGPIHGVLKYVTGTNITLTDVVSGIEELQFVYGDTYQQTYSGKNILNPNWNWSLAKVAMSFDSVTQKLTVTTTTGNGNKYADFYIPASASTDYAFSVESIVASNTSQTNFARIIEYNDSTSLAISHRLSPSDKSETFTTDVQCSIFRILVYSGVSGSVDDTTVYEKLQLESGSTVTSYEPYVGGIPAPNPDYPQDVQVVTGEQTVDVRGNGKNLFDKNNANQFTGYFDGNADSPSLIGSVSARNRVIYIKCKPSTTYSISLTTRDGINSPQVGTTDALPSGGLAVTKLGNFASGSLKLENLTTSATAQYIVIRFQTNPSSVIFDDISQALLAGLQIEQGPTATAYEPYQGQSYEINLGKNLWGGFSADMTRTVYDIDFNNLANGDIFVAAGTSSGQANSLSSSMVAGTDRLLTLEAGTYTISGAIGVIRVQLVNNVGTTLATDTGSGATVILASTTQAFIRVSFDGGQTVTDTTIHPQLEKGSTATSYAPYFTPIELCKIGTYQDYIYKSGDDWYLHKATRHLSLAIADMDNTDSFPGWTNQTQLKSDLGTSSGGQIYTDTSMITNIAGLVTTDSRSVTKNFNGSSATLLLSRNYYGDDFTQTYWKTNYPNLIVNFYYGINGAITDTKITDETLVGQLDALDSAVLPKPIAYITVNSAGSNLPSPLKISYYGRGA